jgi:hypothetical protein
MSIKYLKVNLSKYNYLKIKTITIIYENYLQRR